LHYT